jgi:hypothetical protein
MTLTNLSDRRINTHDIPLPHHAGRMVRMLRYHDEMGCRFDRTASITIAMIAK